MVFFSKLQINMAILLHINKYFYLQYYLFNIVCLLLICHIINLMCVVKLTIHVKFVGENLSSILTKYLLRRDNKL